MAACEHPAANRRPLDALRPSSSARFLPRPQRNRSRRAHRPKNSRRPIRGPCQRRRHAGDQRSRVSVLARLPPPRPAGFIPCPRRLRTRRRHQRQRPSDQRVSLRRLPHRQDLRPPGLPRKIPRLRVHPRALRELPPRRISPRRSSKSSVPTASSASPARSPSCTKLGSSAAPVTSATGCSRAASKESSSCSSPRSILSSDFPCLDLPSPSSISARTR